MSGEREEQFILRVQDPDLADRIRAILREEPATSKDLQLEVQFDGIPPFLYFSNNEGAA